MHKHTAIAYQFTPSLHLGERSGNSTSATAQQQRANRREREQNGKKSTLNKWTDPQSFSSSVHRHVFVEMVDIFFPQHSPASYLLTAFCALHWNVVIVGFFSPWFFVGWICSLFFSLLVFQMHCCTVHTDSCVCVCALCFGGKYVLHFLQVPRAHHALTLALVQLLLFHPCRLFRRWGSAANSVESKCTIAQSSKRKSNGCAAILCVCVLQIENNGLAASAKSNCGINYKQKQILHKMQPNKFTPRKHTKQAQQNKRFAYAFGRKCNRNTQTQSQSFPVKSEKR